MKDIKIDTPLMKIQYVISWIGFIIPGFIISWLIALGLYTYGKDTIDNKEKKKGVLNLTYQKFIFIFGSIVGDLIIFIFFLAFFASFF